MASFSLHRAALWYAGQGLPVFPLTPGRKTPHKGSHGCLDAVLDREQIDAWWTSRPDSNIGMATGHRVDVVDIDGPTGQASRTHHWERIFGRIDADNVGKVLTPRPGGMHIYVPATGEKNATNIVPGVDVRGLGGYVVVPPSTLTGHDGDSPGTYRWLGVPMFERLHQEEP